MVSECLGKLSRCSGHPCIEVLAVFGKKFWTVADLISKTLTLLILLVLLTGYFRLQVEWKRTEVEVDIPRLPKLEIE